MGSLDFYTQIRFEQVLTSTVTLSAVNFSPFLGLQVVGYCPFTLDPAGIPPYNKQYLSLLNTYV